MSQSSIDTAFTALPILATQEVARVLKQGRDKYGEDNWRNISQRDHLDHALAHIFWYLSGLETTEKDLANAVCRLLFAMETT